MSSYKLYYFNIRARAELTRLIFAATETPYEDIRISNWAEQKPLWTISFEGRWSKEALNLPFTSDPTFEIYVICRQLVTRLLPLKPPCGQLPVFEVDGVRLCQSLAIARFAARKTGISGDNPVDEARADMIVDCAKDIMDETISILWDKDATRKAERLKVFNAEKIPKQLSYLENFLVENGGEWFVGKKLNWADLAVPDVIKFLESNNHPIPWSDLPKMEAHRKKVEAIPAIAKYIAARPETVR